MAQVLAVGSPKGGVGKTVSAVTLATIAAKLMKLHVLLVDADDNASALDWAGGASDEDMPLDAAAGAHNPQELGQLRYADYDLVVVDLAGAREGNFQTILRGDGGEPAADLVLIPSKAEQIDFRPVARVIKNEVEPLGAPYLLVLTQVLTASMDRARYRHAELKASGYAIADTIVRAYSTHNEASEVHKTVLDLPGRHSYARAAEDDYRSLAAEVFQPLGFDTDPLKEKSPWLA